MTISPMSARVAPSGAQLPVRGDHPSIRVSGPVTFHLLHGSSDDAPAFQHDPRTPDGTATVGASTGCDWTVRAAGVPALAFSVREQGGLTSILPGPDATVLLDGRRIAPLWVPVYEGNRIDVGLLRVELRAASLDRGEADRPTFVDLPEPRHSRMSLPNVPCVLGKPKRSRPIHWGMVAGLSAIALVYALLLAFLE